jgi:hypothetical protein
VERELTWVRLPSRRAALVELQTYLENNPAEAVEEPPTVALDGEPLGEHLRAAKRWTPNW